MDVVRGEDGSNYKSVYTKFESEFLTWCFYTTKVVGRLNQDNIMFLKQYSVVVALLFFHEMVSFSLFDRFY